jgi:hypothetical protein
MSETAKEVVLEYLKNFSCCFTGMALAILVFYMIAVSSDDEALASIAADVSISLLSASWIVSAGAAAAFTFELVEEGEE